MREKSRGPNSVAILSVSLVALILLQSGCSDQPTDANALVAALPLEQLALRDTTILSTGSSTFRQFIPMDGDVNLLGQSGEYNAFFALQFFPSVFPSRDTVLVERATLTLRAVTRSGDGSGQLAFTVYRIDRQWSESAITWDSVQSGFYNSAVVRGTYSAVAGADTELVTVELDTAMVREWLRTPTSTTDTKYGIMLVPSVGTSIVRGFTSFESFEKENRPSLQIIATNVSGTTRDTSKFENGIDTFVGNVENLTSDPGLVYIQAGVVYRGILRFDIGFIPRDATINRAALLLELDPSTSRFTRFTGDTAVASHTRLSETDNSVFEFERSSAYGRRKEGTAKTFEFNIPEAVQAWVKGPNYGLLLRARAAAEINSFDLYTFHNETAADTSLRPRLRILYSVKK